MIIEFLSLILEPVNLISAAIKQCRAQHGLSQKALGKLLGVSQPHVGNLEDGTMVPSVPTLKRIAKFFGFTPAQIGEFVLTTDGIPPGYPMKRRSRVGSRPQMQAVA